ncbi:hypothetical protein [Promicromonospora sukumoe]|uniref:hypothetical protein n=1 Tax=Promicromonospora sukumoe TaxID=88382 RepID=UPI0003A1D598|nr:hypothetical protein [Promicromonospora sukumoe]
MRHPTHSRPVRRHAPAALLLALVLCAGTSCAWGGGEDTSGGDTEQTDSTDDGGGGTGGGGGGDNGGGGGGGGQPSPIRVSRATEQSGSGASVAAVAEQTAREMAAECPGGELCVTIYFKPEVGDCDYSGSDPAAGELIEVGATLTLFGVCDETPDPSPEEDGEPTEDDTGATGDG